MAKRSETSLLIASVFAAGIFFGYMTLRFFAAPKQRASSGRPTTGAAPRPAPASASFSDGFARAGMLKEGGEMRESESADWWVNSGAYLYFADGVAKTVMGELPKDDERRVRYAQENPDETDDGYHPQNIFRLVTRTTWTDFEQQAYYKIDAYHLSKSVHRFEANGILLFNRYLDGDDLYYAGLRVDGDVVIKKKIGGQYFTMAEKKLLPGAYDRDKSPNLIPLNEWIGLKTVVSTAQDGSVTVRLLTDVGRTGTWTLALEARDDGSSYGGAAIVKEGYAGIRTDFMDVEFSDYRIAETR